VVKLSDGAAAGVDEKERQYSVDETSEACEEHSGAECGGMRHVLDVGLTDGSRMRGEYPGEFHAQRLLAALR